MAATVDNWETSGLTTTNTTCLLGRRCVKNPYSTLPRRRGVAIIHNQIVAISWGGGGGGGGGGRGEGGRANILFTLKQLFKETQGQE